MEHRLKENNEVLILLYKRIELLENQLSNVGQSPSLYNWKISYFFIILILIVALTCTYLIISDLFVKSLITKSAVNSYNQQAL